VAVVALTLAIAALGLGPLLLVHGLPVGRLATHWGLDGRVNGSMTRPQFAWVVGVVCAAAVVVALWAATRRSLRAPGHLVALTVVTLLAEVAAGAARGTVVANHGHTSWRTVAGPSVVVVLASIATGLAPALAVAALAERFTERAAAPSMVPARLGLPAGRRAAWIGHQHNATLLAAGGADGLRIGYGPIHLPRTHVPLDRMAVATAIDVRPMRWGGWGYRGSLRWFRQAAVVVRGGPGIRVDLRDGRVFVVTVTDAATGAAALNEAIAVAASTAGAS
jgi:hypothetical protein